MAKYKVSYTQIMNDGKEKRSTTAVSYDTKAAAQKYANQLNKGGSYKNARVKKA